MADTRKLLYSSLETFHKKLSVHINYYRGGGGRDWKFSFSYRSAEVMFLEV